MTGDQVAPTAEATVEPPVPASAAGAPERPARKKREPITSLEAFFARRTAKPASFLILGEPEHVAEEPSHELFQGGRGRLVPFPGGGAVRGLGKSFAIQLAVAGEGEPRSRTTRAEGSMGSGSAWRRGRPREIGKGGGRLWISRQPDHQPRPRRR